MRGKPNYELGDLSIAIDQIAKDEAPRVRGDRGLGRPSLSGFPGGEGLQGLGATKTLPWRDLGGLGGTWEDSEELGSPGVLV